MEKIKRAGFAVTNDESKVLLQVGPIPPTTSLDDLQRQLKERFPEEQFEKVEVLKSILGNSKAARFTAKRSAVPKLVTWKSWTVEAKGEPEIRPSLLHWRSRVPPKKLFCRKCWSEGHTSGQCSVQPRCGCCGAADHRHTDCQKEPVPCLFCGGRSHLSPQCAEASWTFEELDEHGNTIRLPSSREISAARSRPVGPSSFASVAATPPPQILKLEEKVSQLAAELKVLKQQPADDLTATLSSFQSTLSSFQSALEMLITKFASHEHAIRTLSEKTNVTVDLLSDARPSLAEPSKPAEKKARVNEIKDDAPSLSLSPSPSPSVHAPVLPSHPGPDSLMLDAVSPTTPRASDIPRTQSVKRPRVTTPVKPLPSSSTAVAHAVVSTPSSGPTAQPQPASVQPVPTQAVSARPVAPAQPKKSAANLSSRFAKTNTASKAPL